LGIVIFPSENEATGESCKEDRVVAAPERDGSACPHAADPTKSSGTRHPALQTQTLPLANLAL
jgi:hypothetical protein